VEITTYPAIKALIVQITRSVFCTFRHICVRRNATTQLRNRFSTKETKNQRQKKAELLETNCHRLLFSTHEKCDVVGVLRESILSWRTMHSKTMASQRWQIERESNLAKLAPIRHLSAAPTLFLSPSISAFWFLPLKLAAGDKVSKVSNHESRQLPKRNMFPSHGPYT
jgi:hypothetical protein